MYYTTGFAHSEIEALCALIAEIQQSIPLTGRREWPPILGLGNSVVITLAYLRRNRVQWELAETYGVSQSTISRAITAVTPLLSRALARFIPTAEELRPDRQYIVDGTLLPWALVSFPWVPPGAPRSLRGRPSQVKGACGVAERWRYAPPWTCEPRRPLRAALRAGQGPALHIARHPQRHQRPRQTHLMQPYPQVTTPVVP